MSIKETMKTILDGGIAYTKKIVKSGINFVKEHPEETMYILIGGVIVGCAVGAAISKKKQRDILPSFGEEKCEQLSKMLDDIVRDHEEKVKTWNEKYKETWDTVNEFAKTLKLQPGEMYIIEDQMQFQGDDYFSEVDFSMPVISHMVFNEGIYPPGE